MYMERYMGLNVIFFGIEHRQKERGDGGKVLNKEAKQGWRFCSQTQQHSFTDENAGSEDCKHTSGGVSLAIGNVTEKKERSRLLLDMR